MKYDYTKNDELMKLCDHPVFMVLCVYCGKVLHDSEYDNKRLTEEVQTSASKSREHRGEMVWVLT